MDFNDEQLMLLFARGRTEAFEELYRRHAGRVFGFLFRVSGRSRHEVEDLVQETFLRVTRAREAWRPSGPFVGWLLRVARNCWLNHEASLRARRGLRVVRAFDDGAADERAAPGPDPAGRALDREADEALARALATLPEQQRAAFVLRQYEGLDYAAIAEVLGISLSNVKTSLHRARARLVELLGEWLGSAPGARREG